MKKLLFILMLSVVLVLTACGGDEKKGNDTNSTEQTNAVGDVVNKDSEQNTIGNIELPDMPNDNSTKESDENAATEDSEISSDKSEEATQRPTPETDAVTEKRETEALTFPFTNREPIELPDL